MLYRDERSRRWYYGFAWILIAVGCAGLWFGWQAYSDPELQSAYSTSPTCDEGRLTARERSFTTPCAVVSAVVTSHDPDLSSFVVDDRARLEALGPKADRRMFGVVTWDGGTPGQPVMLQLYAEKGSFRITKIYDPATKRVYSEEHRPVLPADMAWRQIRFGLILLGVGIVWIWAGRFAAFDGYTVHYEPGQSPADRGSERT
jgi:hypothetical protein